MKQTPYRTVVVGACALAGVAAVLNLALTWAGAYSGSAGLVAVLVVEFVGLWLILRATAAPGRGFLQQLAAGALAVAILATLMFPTAYFAVTVVAPGYETLVVDAQRRQLEADGSTAEEVEERLRELQAIPVPVRTAGMTVIATLITCLPMILLLAFVYRDRGASQRA